MAAGLAVAVSAVAPGSVALADQPGIQISISSWSPNIWHPGEALVVTGAVTNSTRVDIAGARVVLWQSPSAIVSLPDLEAALTSKDVTTPVGVTAKDATSSQVLASSPGVLAAGASAGFSLRGGLSLPKTGAAYLVGVQVLDRTGKVLARARLAMGVAPVDAGSVVVPLVARPTLISPAETGDSPSQAIFGDDSLAQALRGDLGHLIDLASQPGVTSLIDPALMSDLAAMVGGYKVASGPGELVAGTGADDAETALARIKQIVDDGHAYRLPANNPDLNAVVAVPQAASVVAAASSLDPSSPLAGLPLAVYVAQALTAPAQNLLDTIAPSLVVCDALQTAATVQQSKTATIWVAAVPADALGDITGPAPALTTGANFQRMSARLARLVVAAGSGAPTVLVAGDGTAAQLVSQLLGAGWASTPLDQRIAQAKPASLSWASKASASKVPAAASSSIRRISDQVAWCADVGNDPQACSATAARLLPGVFAGAWNGDWTAAQDWLSQASGALDKQVGSGSVALQVAAEWHLSSSNNRLPITIVNTLGIPVRVSVHFTSENTNRLSVPDSDYVVVEAGSTATVVVAPHAAGNGSVEVTATLTTASGTPVGAPVHVQVVTTSAGRLAWVIIIGAGIAFVVATSLRVRQVRHQRRSAPTERP